MLVEERAVGQPRKGIVISQELDPLLGGFALRDVFRGAFEVDYLAVFVANRANIERQPFGGTIQAVGLGLDTGFSLPETSGRAPEKGTFSVLFNIISLQRKLHVRGQS